MTDVNSLIPSYLARKWMLLFKYAEKSTQRCIKQLWLQPTISSYGGRLNQLARSFGWAFCLYSTHEVWRCANFLWKVCSLPTGTDLHLLEIFHLKTNTRAIGFHHWGLGIHIAQLPLGSTCFQTYASSTRSSFKYCLGLSFVNLSYRMGTGEYHMA